MEEHIQYLKQKAEATEKQEEHEEKDQEPEDSNDSYMNYEKQNEVMNLLKEKVSKIYYIIK